MRKRIPRYVAGGLLVLCAVGCAPSWKKSGAGRRLYSIETPEGTGYINRQGEVVIPARFEYAGQFCEGLASVYLADAGRGYIDERGEFVIGPQSDWTWGYDFSEGLARVTWYAGVGHPGTTLKDHAFIDRQGNFITSRKYRSAGDFSEGLARVLVDSLFGYIDRRGRLVIPPRFERADDFSEGLARVWEKYPRDATIPYFINRRGKKVLDLGDSIYLRGGFHEGLAPFRLRGRHRKCGYVDKRGRIVIAPTLPAAYAFNEGRGRILDGDKIGWIDRAGTVIIAPQYRRLSHDFSEGLAAVITDSGWAYIDTTGAIVTPAGSSAGGDFRGGLARVTFYTADGRRTAYINRKGEYVWKSWADKRP